MIRSLRLVVCVLAVSAYGLVGPAFAQDAPADPNPGALTLTAAVDAVSTYMFRGIRQNSTGIAVQPFADVGVAFLSGDGGVRSVTLNMGTWNSLHTGDTGNDSASGNMWYESDFYTTFGVGVAGGLTFGSTFTAYTSPNALFTTVREVAFRVSLDDSGFLGGAAVRPYAVLALEVLADPGVGQADGGDNAGRYLEVGLAPGLSLPGISVSVPLKVGLSVGDYYELRDIEGTIVGDNPFGFFSVAAIVTVPLGGTSRFGALNIHGGVEYQRLGDMTRVFNDGDEHKVIGSFGIGLAY
jgi:hypothetical protein